MDEAQHLAGFSVTFGLQFRIDQLPVRANLEAATVRGNEHHALDHVLIILEQLTCQANCPVGIMSNCAINDLDLEHKHLSI